MIIQLFDKNTKTRIANLTQCNNICLESTLQSGDGTLSFYYPLEQAGRIENESYLRTQEAEYVIKEVLPTSGSAWVQIKADLNTENLVGKPWQDFETIEQTIDAALRTAFAGTGWNVTNHGVTRKRTLRLSGSAWDVLQQAIKTYRVEVKLDTLAKVVHVYEHMGEDKGVYFMDSLNLKQLEVQKTSYDFYTRVQAVGKDGLTFADINGGKDYVENHRYTTKVKTLFWKDERYTDKQSLKEDAQAKLDEMAKVTIAYKADVIDLAKAKPAEYSILSYQLGDTITLIDRKTMTREKQRIVKMTTYPDKPVLNACEIANKLYSFADIQQEQNNTNNTVNNITDSNNTVTLSAINGAITQASIIKATIQDLTAAVARIGDLEATRATITELHALYAEIGELLAGKATIADLEAAVARIGVAEIDVAKIKDLVNGNLTSDNIQSLILTSDKVTVDALFVKNEIASRIYVADLLAGTISTNQFRIASDNGGILIDGPTQQFKDGDGNVRLQIGQDGFGRFNFILQGPDGQGAIIDTDGIHQGAIPDGLIVDIMINSNANIDGGKINIPSLVTEINGNTETIKSSLIAYDDTGQTLDVLFGQLKTTTEELKTTTQSLETNLSVQSGQIQGLISDSTIESGGTSKKLKDAFAALTLTVDGLSSKVTEHESKFGDYATTTALSSVIEQTKREINQSVSATYTTKDTLKNYSTTEQMNGAINTKAGSILLDVSKAYTTIDSHNSLKSRVDNAEIKLEPSAITLAVQNAITGGDATLNTGSIKLTADDFIIKSANLQVQDSSGTNVLYGDQAGNLNLAGTVYAKGSVVAEKAIYQHLKISATEGVYSLAMKGGEVMYINTKGQLRPTVTRLGSVAYSTGFGFNQGDGRTGMLMWSKGCLAIHAGDGSSHDTEADVPLELTTRPLLFLTPEGSVFCFGNFNNQSSRKFKENIKPYTGASEIIQKGVICEYNLKMELEKGIHKKHYGLIAEEAPQEVSADAMSVNSYDMASITWQAVKEILVRNEQLEKRIRVLEKARKTGGIRIA